MSIDELNKINTNAELIASKIYELIGANMPSTVALIKWVEETFGLRITIKYTKLDCSGLVYYDSIVKKYQIRINNNEPLYRQRFTICHEIAHIIRNMGLTYGFSTGNIFTSKGLERFCERFAATFLMPASLFVKKWKSISDKDLLKKARIAEYFNVSVDAARYRAEELNLIR